MAIPEQMLVNRQALRNAKWKKVSESADGYCFVDGKENALFFLATMQGVRVLYPVNREIKTIGTGEAADPSLAVWVFANEKK